MTNAPQRRRLSTRNRNIEHALGSDPLPVTWHGVQPLEPRLLLSAVTETTHLLAPGGGAGDQFGQTIDISGDLMIVGASGRDTAAGRNAGAAQIFQRSGTAWNLLTTLAPNDAGAGDLFGTAVAIDGNLAVVTAAGDNPGTGNSAGSAYVFQFNGSSWVQVNKIFANDGTAGDQFGVSVDISGTNIIVGAFQEDTSLSNVGAAYVFQNSGGGFVQTAKLAGDATAFAQFGISVGISGTTAIIGAHGESTASGSNAGAAYVFSFNGSQWLRQAKLEGNDLVGFDQFGISVSIDGDTAVIGSWLDDDGGSAAGSAYVFERTGTTWTQKSKLMAPDAAAGDQFGRSVGVSGDRIVIGANNDNLNALIFDSGSVYVFGRSGASWTNLSQLIASDAKSNDGLGRAVAIDGVFAAGGANFDDTAAGVDAGSVYILQLGLVQPPVVGAKPQVQVAKISDASENGTTGIFRITRDNTNGDLTVKLKRGGKATFGSDYRLSVNGVNLTTLAIVIPDGQSFVDLNVDPIDDTRVEITETVIITLSSNSAYTIDPAASSATLDLTDNEPLVQITSIANASEDGTSGTFRISRDNTNGDMAVKLKRTGSAKFGSDYQLSVNGVNLTSLNIVIPDGQSFIDLQVDAIDDALAEVTETVIIAVSKSKTYSIDPAASSASVDLTDNEPLVQITSIANASEDGTSGIFRISRDTTSGDVTVKLAQSGTAKFGSDYQLSVNGVDLTSLTIVIPDGQSFIDLKVDPIDDTLAEITETVVITVASSAAFSVDPAASSATLDLTDNEPQVQITSIANASEDGTSGIFRISRDNTNGDLTVKLKRGGKATFGSDYRLSVNGVDLTSLDIVIPDGQSFVDLKVDPIDDTRVEITETVIITLSSNSAYSIDPAASSASLDLTDNEPLVQITSLGDASEDGTSGTFRISRDNTNGDMIVKLKRSGTAKFGSDYQLSVNGVNLSSLNIVIPDGQSFIDLKVDPIDDALAEITETVIFAVSKSNTYSVDPAASSASLDLTDNEPLVQITSLGDASEDGTPGTFRISRDTINGDLTVKLKRAGKARFGSDYRFSVNGVDLTSLSIVIPDGQSFIDLNVNAFDDKRVEITETVIVTISKSKTYNIDPVASSASLDITDTVLPVV